MSSARRPGPALTLLLTAPVLGELVSGHMTPLQFLNPVTFAILALPYGFGALLCREATVRWKRSRLSLLLLALAFGIYEEGLVARSVWDPGWAELRAIGPYSFWHGVTWTYAAALLHFHVTVSIASSVILVHLLYPGRRSEPWLTRCQWIACAAGLALWMPALWLLHPFTPPAWAVAAAAVGIALLVLGAGRLRVPALPRPRRGPGGPLRYGLVAGVATTAVFVVVFMLPDSAAARLFPWPVSLGAVLAVDGIAVRLILRWSGGGELLDDRHEFSLAAGSLAFFLVFGGLQDLDGPFRGRAVVSLAAAAALWRLYGAVRRRASVRAPAGAGVMPPRAAPPTTPAEP